MSSVKAFLVQVLVLSLAGSLPAAVFKDGDTVVFLGDSLTHGGSYHARISDFYRTRFPDARIRFVNSGYGGNTVAGGRRRLKEDVFEYNPTWVMFAFGVNDVDVNVFNRGEMAKGASPLLVGVRKQLEFRKQLDLLIGELHAGAPRARLIYGEPAPYDDQVRPKSDPHCLNNRPGCGTGVMYIAGSVAEFAGRDKAPLVNWYTSMREFLRRHQETDETFTVFNPDRTHPSPLGQELLAWMFLLDTGVPALVSTVSVDMGTLKSEVNGAEVTGVAVCGAVLTFDVLSKSLPFPVSADARPFADEFDFTSKLSHEGLSVSGLKPGTYELKIDGEAVGRYSAEQFASGVELALNAKTPQYRQAMRVREANEKLRLREEKMRNCHYARGHFGTRAPVDDMKAFAVWAAENINEKSPPWDKTFAPYIKGYLEYWPRHHEIRDQLWRDQDAVRQLARPVRHRYEVVRVAE